MDTNLIVAIGSLVVLFAVPATIRKWAEERSMLVPLASLVIATAAMTLALALAPGEFSLTDIPYAVIEVLGRFL